MSWPLTATKRLTRSTKRCMSRYEPWKVNVNGSVARPAVPTTAPGGSCEAATWVAGAAVPVVLAPVAGGPGEAGAVRAAAEPVALDAAATPAGVVAFDVLPFSLIERKAIFAPRATPCSS